MWVMLLLSLLSVPAVYLNYNGQGVTVDKRDPLGLSLLTLGNHGIPNTTLCDDDAKEAALQAAAEEEQRRIDRQGAPVTVPTPGTGQAAANDTVDQSLFDCTEPTVRLLWADLRPRTQSYVISFADLMSVALRVWYFAVYPALLLTPAFLMTANR